MGGNLNDEVIACIKQYVPNRENVAAWLCANLKIERESAYRRLRGEVIFTFEEVAKISFLLGFSVDMLLDANNTTHALFDIHLLNKSSYMEIYRNKISELSNLYRRLAADEKGKERIAVNSLPYLLSIPKPLLSKFRLYKWIYQTQNVKCTCALSDLVLTSDVLDVHDYFIESIKGIPHVIGIVDNNLFKAVVADINYFRKRSLISDEELGLLKRELLELIDFLEEVMSTGKGPGGGTVEIYLSAVEMDSSYSHFEYGNQELCFMRIYSITAVDSRNHRVCKLQKEWIETLKKFSTLISQSGEIERFKFLDTQRGYIEQLQ